MSVEVERATIACGVCGAQVGELRRGRCWGCYIRWADARPVGRGAACTICFEKRREQLKLIELHGRSLPFCHGCAARIGKLPAIPSTVEAVRRALQRDRRDADRRAGKLDHRIFPRERRVGERRGPPRSAKPDTNPHIPASDLEEIIIELDAAEMEEVEQTSVRSARAGTK